jgi:DNA processing protein
MRNDVRYWLGLSAFPGIGPARFGLLLEYFHTVKRIWEAPRDALIEIGFGEKLTQSFDHFRNTFNLVDYQKRLQENHVGVVTIDDFRYPKLLKEIVDPPFLLYVKGRKMSTPIDMEKTIAIVGSRKATPYGLAITKQLTRDLVAAGYTIISGMAYGIDAMAHETAIACGGKTIAVLGCGVDICAPLANIHIYRKLSDEGFGAVVSEMPLGLRPEKGLFVARNRIISGLSRGVVVVEGEKDSGTLITAKNAAEQGRDVFAVPGPITSPTSRGPAALLKNGAILVESAHDILEHV